VREGFALINLKAPYRSAYQEQYTALENAKQEAKRNRAGAYEFGDGKHHFFFCHESAKRD
jgi:staphylococcal nuclease domain-containing protein 1